MQALVGWRSGKVMQLEVTYHVAGTDAAVEETAGRISSILQLSFPVHSLQLHVIVQPTVHPCFCAMSEGEHT